MYTGSMLYYSILDGNETGKGSYFLDIFLRARDQAIVRNDSIFVMDNCAVNPSSRINGILTPYLPLIDPNEVSYKTFEISF